MATYTLPNIQTGGSSTVNAPSLAAAESQAQAAGTWNPGAGTYGANSGPDVGGGGGGGGGGSSSGGGDLSGLQAALAASSGLSIKQLDEQKREFDANLAWQQQMWQNQGLPQLAIQQRAQDLAEAQFQQTVQQAQFNQSLQTRQQNLAEQVQLGQLSIAQAQQQLADEIQHGQLAVSQGQLGLDTLKTAASLSGPQNWIQAANFNRGVAANSVLPGFVSDLLTGKSTATMGGPAPGAQMSNPLSLQGIAGQMGAPGASPTAVGNQTPNLGVPAYAYTPPAAFTAQGAAVQSSVPQGLPAGFTSVNQNGTTTFTPTGGTAAASTAGASSAALDPNHMAQFYAQAVQAAGTGGNTGNPTTAQTPTGTPQQQQTDAGANALAKIYAQGGQALGPQQLEGLTPTEQQMFTGGGAAIGADVPGYIQAYQNSRIGQKAAAPAVASS